VLVHGRIEQMLTGCLEFMLPTQGGKEPRGGAEVRNYRILSARGRLIGGRGYVLPADTDMPAPAMTTIFLFLRSANSNLSSCSSSPSVRVSRSI